MLGCPSVYHIACLAVPVSTTLHAWLSQCLPHCTLCFPSVYHTGRLAVARSTSMHASTLSAYVFHRAVVQITGQSVLYVIEPLSTTEAGSLWEEVQITK